MFEKYKKECYDIIAYSDGTYEDSKTLDMLTDKMIALCPERYEGYYLKSASYYCENRFELYQKVIDMTEGAEGDADCYHARACCYYNLGKYEEAVKNSDLAISLKSDCSKFYVRRADIKVSLGDYEGAFEDYETGISLKDDFLTAKFFNSQHNIWNVPIYAKKYDKALEYLIKYLDYQKTKPEGYSEIKELQKEAAENPEKYTEQDYLEIAENARIMGKVWILAYAALSVLVKNPNLSKVFYMLAQNCDEDSADKQAYYFIKTALELEPENAEYNFAYAEIIQKYLLSENDYNYDSFSEDDINDIVSKYEKALALGLDNADYYHAFACFLSSVHRYEKALYYFDSAIEKDTSASWFFAHRALIKAHLKDYIGVIDDIETVFLKGDSDVHVFQEIQGIYGEDSELILEFYKILSDRFVNNEDCLQTIFNSKIYYLNSINEHETVVEECDKFLSQYQGNSRIYFNLAEALICKQKPEPEKTLYWLDKAVEADVKCLGYANYYYFKGEAFMLLERFEEALACYDKAVELESWYGDSYFKKGCIYQFLEKFDEAIEMYDKAIEINNGAVGESYFNKGSVLVDLKRYEEALQCFEAALPICPDLEERIIEAIKICKDNLEL